MPAGQGSAEIGDRPAGCGKAAVGGCVAAAMGEEAIGAHVHAAL